MYLEIYFETVNWCSLWPCSIGKNDDIWFAWIPRKEKDKNLHAFIYVASTLWIIIYDYSNRVRLHRSYSQGSNHVICCMTEALDKRIYQHMVGYIA